MSTDDVNKVHEKAAENDLKAHNYTLAGKADDVGIIAKNSANPDGNGEAPEQKKKKERDFEALLHLQQEIMKDIKNGMADISAMLDQYKKSIEYMKRLLVARESNDIDAMRILMIEKYGEEARDWSDDQTTAQVDNEIEFELKDQLELEERLKAKIKECSDKLKTSGLSEDQKQEIRDDLEDQKIELENMVVEHNALIKEYGLEGIVEKLDYNSAKYSVRTDLVKEGSDSHTLVESGFQQGNYDGALNSNKWEKESISFSSTLDEDDLFATETGSLTSPFNEVASLVENGNSDIENNQTIAPKNGEPYDINIVDLGMKLP